MAKIRAVPQSVKEKLGPWYDKDFLDDVVVMEGSILGWLFGRFGQHAVTIDGAVHLTALAPGLESDRGTALFGHECFHVQQQRDMGWWRFLARYAMSWRPTHIRKGWKHPLERPAYDRGREILRALRG